MLIIDKEEQVVVLVEEEEEEEEEEGRNETKNNDYSSMSCHVTIIYEYPCCNSNLKIFILKYSLI
jgi:hypothetical protein